MGMKWAAAILLAASLGCGKPEDPVERAERERERRASEALRKEMEVLLEKTRSLSLARWDPISDGGSHVFWFKTDSGAGFQVLMLHDRKDKGGNTRYQEFRLSKLTSNDDCEIERGSTLERHLVDLLSDCRLDAGTGSWKPTADAIPWLQRKLIDRTIPFDSPPHTR
jgi:hypothetical protein